METEKTPFWMSGRFWLKLFALFVFFILFVILIDKVIMPWYVRLGEEIELPDVVEMTVSDAEKKLHEEGFFVIIADSVYNSYYPSGTVVEQLPLPYSVVKKGRHVYLTVSSGEKPIIMPNLFYKSPRDAELILQTHNLKLQAKTYEYSDFSLAGVVIAQSYPAGQLVKANTPISITISLGPFPKRKTVPHLVGKSLLEARKQLRLLGVKDIEIEYKEREKVLPETVIAQEPENGTVMTDSMRVKLTVSKVKALQE